MDRANIAQNHANMSPPSSNPNAPTPEQQQSMPPAISPNQKSINTNAAAISFMPVPSGETRELQRVIRKQNLNLELQKHEIQELREQQGREREKQELQLEFQRQEMQEMRNQLDHLLHSLKVPMERTNTAEISQHSCKSNPPLQQPNNNVQLPQPFLVGYNKIVSCSQQEEALENNNEPPPPQPVTSVQNVQNTEVPVEKGVSVGMKLPTARPLALPTSGEAGHAAARPAAIEGVAAPTAAQNFAAVEAAGAEKSARIDLSMSGPPAAMGCFTQLPPLEPFDPSKSEERDFKLFEMEFQQRMRLEGVPFHLWPDRLLLYLKGHARAYIYNLTNSRPDGEPLNYNALIEILASTFQIDAPPRLSIQTPIFDGLEPYGKFSRPTLHENLNDHYASLSKHGR